MVSMILRKWLSILSLLAGIVLLTPVAAADKDEDFKPLFNGKDFTGWKFMLQGKTEPEKTFSIKDGVIVTNGKPNGFFYTDKSFKNYIIRYDWRFVRPADLKDDSAFKGNSGCLVHIHDPEKGIIGGIWPRSIEVQGMNLTHGKLLFLPRSLKGEEKYNKEAKDKATKPVGEWNTTEIFCGADGTLSAKINGAEVSSGKCELTEGPIGFQSEGVEIHFKNIVIKELK